MYHAGFAVQRYVAKVEAQLPTPRQDVRREVLLAEVPLEAVRSVCCFAGTAAFFCENLPHLQRFIRERCPALSAEEVAFGGAVAAFEALSGRCLKVLDAGILSQLVKYVDGPALPGSGVQVLTANAAAWRIEQVRRLAYCNEISPGPTLR